MRVSLTVVYDVPDDLVYGELSRMQTKLAQQVGPQDIRLRAGTDERRIVSPRVYTVSRPLPVPE